jgi:hypothetical protein
MEHSVDPPFPARLTGGLVARFVSGVLGFQVASFASPLACPMGCFHGAQEPFLKEQCNRDFPTSEHPFDSPIHHTHTNPSAAVCQGICLWCPSKGKHAWKLAPHAPESLLKFPRAVESPPTLKHGMPNTLYELSTSFTTLHRSLVTHAASGRRESSCYRGLSPALLYLASVVSFR